MGSESCVFRLNRDVPMGGLSGRDCCDEDLKSGVNGEGCEEDVDLGAGASRICDWARLWSSEMDGSDSRA